MGVHATALINTTVVANDTFLCPARESGTSSDERRRFLNFNDDRGNEFFTFTEGATDEARELKKDAQPFFTELIYLEKIRGQTK